MSRDRAYVKELEVAIAKLVGALEQIENKPIVHGPSWDIAVKALEEFRKRAEVRASLSIYDSLFDTPRK